MGGRAAHVAAEIWRKCFGRGAIVAIFYALLATPASAQEAPAPTTPGPAVPGAATPTPLTLIGGVNVMHDTNIFRLAPSVDPVAVLGSPEKSETVTQLYAGLRFDKQLSQQQLQGEVRFSQYRYQRFDYLDYEALDYRGAWRYYFTPYLRGTLSADRTEQQVPFSEYQGRLPNVRITEAYRGNAEFSFSPTLQLVVGALQSEQSSSVQVLAEADFRMTQLEAGVRYLPASGSMLAFTQRRGDGAYINRPVPVGTTDNGFRQNDSEVQLTWAISARTQLRGTAVWFNREHDNLSQLDDSGYSAQGMFAWDSGGKLRLELLGSSGIAPYFDGTGGYRSEQVYAITPTWQALSKVALRLRLEQTDTEYNGVPRRNDRTRRAEFGIDWTATRWAMFGLRAERQQRDSSDPAFDYTTTITSFNLSLSF